MIENKHTQNGHAFNCLSHHQQILPWMSDLIIIQEFFTQRTVPLWIKSLMQYNLEHGSLQAINSVQNVSSFLPQYIFCNPDWCSLNDRQSVSFAYITVNTWLPTRRFAHPLLCVSTIWKSSPIMFRRYFNHRFQQFLSFWIYEIIKSVRSTKDFHLHSINVVPYVLT